MGCVSTKNADVDAKDVPFEKSSKKSHGASKKDAAANETTPVNASELAQEVKGSEDAVTDAVCAEDVTPVCENNVPLVNGNVTAEKSTDDKKHEDIHSNQSSSPGSPPAESSDAILELCAEKATESNAGVSNLSSEATCGTEIGEISSVGGNTDIDDKNADASEQALPLDPPCRESTEVNNAPHAEVTATEDICTEKKAEEVSDSVPQTYSKEEVCDEQSGDEFVTTTDAVDVEVPLLPNTSEEDVKCVEDILSPEPMEDNQPLDTDGVVVTTAPHRHLTDPDEAACQPGDTVVSDTERRPASDVEACQGTVPESSVHELPVGDVIVTDGHHEIAECESTKDAVVHEDELPVSDHDIVLDSHHETAECESTKDAVVHEDEMPVGDVIVSDSHHETAECESTKDAVVCDLITTQPDSSNLNDEQSCNTGLNVEALIQCESQLEEKASVETDHEVERSERVSSDVVTSDDVVADIVDKVVEESTKEDNIPVSVDGNVEEANVSNEYQDHLEQIAAELVEDVCSSASSIAGTEDVNEAEVVEDSNDNVHTPEVCEDLKNDVVASHPEASDVVDDQAADTCASDGAKHDEDAQKEVSHPMADVDDVSGNEAHCNGEELPKAEICDSESIVDTKTDPCEPVQIADAKLNAVDVSSDHPQDSVADVNQHHDNFLDVSQQPDVHES